MLGVPPITFHIHITSPHTPYTQKPLTPLQPHFSGTIFGKYTHLFM